MNEHIDIRPEESIFEFLHSPFPIWVILQNMLWNVVNYPENQRSHNFFILNILIQSYNSILDPLCSLVSRSRHMLEKPLDIIHQLLQLSRLVPLLFEQWSLKLERSLLECCEYLVMLLSGSNVVVPNLSKLCYRFSRRSNNYSFFFLFFFLFFILRAFFLFQSSYFVTKVNNYLLLL